MKKRDYLIVQVLSVINLLIFLSPLRYFLYVSKVLMVLFSISSLVYTILIFIGIVKREINIFVGLISLLLSVICLRYAAWILDAFFHVDNLFL